MRRLPKGSDAGRLHPGKVGYWYHRLNGLFQIENFVVRPTRCGGQRTDTDLLAVRFPFRAERLLDDPNDIMADDEQRLALSRDRVDVVIAEVKTNQPCTLNGPWARPDQQNVDRVLVAIGCLPHDQIKQAAADNYRAVVPVTMLGQSWARESGQVDKWIFCLTTARLAEDQEIR
jgi:hypothetical protein